MKEVSLSRGLWAVGTTVLLLWLALPGGGGLWPLLAVALVPFLVTVLRTTWRRALILGFLAGCTHFLLQLYWIVFVLGHYGGLPLYFSIPALLLLACYMGTYLVAFGLLARFFARALPPALSLWLLPCVWVGLDWLRSFLFSGFPWMDLGYGLSDVVLLLQSADLWGHYGLTFLIVLVNTLLALLFLHRREKGGKLVLLLPVTLLLLLVFVYSSSSLRRLERTLAARPTMAVAVVQGNVDQGQKWLPQRQQQTVLDYIKQSHLLMQKSPRPQLVVWPETALPFYPIAHPLLEPVRRFTAADGVMLLTGAPWYQRNDSSGKLSFFNSALLFDPKGELVARTSKTHLVPFGEYVPLRQLLPFLEPLVEAVGDFTPGKIDDPPACQKARIGVLVCFESIFPDISRKWVDAGATLLVDMTNDAWYGRSSAPHQTLAMTRLRAVETRRSLVRAANTGFSAFIDPAGRVNAVSPLFAPWGAVDRVYLMGKRTVFVRGGFLFGPLCLFLAGAAWLGAFLRQRKE